MEHRTFTWDLGKENRIIRGDVYAATTKSPLPVVILCHGFKGFKNWGFFPHAAKVMADQGFAVITFNFSMNGVGESLEEFDELDKFARNTYSREQEDLAYLLDRLLKGDVPLHEAMDIDKIALVGHSRGGGNSLIFAMDHPEIGAVVLWNSIARVDLFSDELKREIREKGVATILNARTGQAMPIYREVLDDLERNRERFDILNRLPSFERPLLILHGSDDRSVPLAAAKQLSSAAANARLVIIEGADHTFGCVHPFRGTTPYLDQALDETARFLHHTWIDTPHG
ncbi:alpha/beta hydrolase family protein [Polycladomyces subterraneus]|uniref:Alpha/beta hydrolase n=1 Tax=Polycladomyces subterraneus TaxID=1016997 RepID=A0ABT8IMQ8_9BACL|nr:alpha/beta fold hydrolase [Polycladomyces subterraneus]MDN4594060.1 alpha/beta hydrolase [Polycladomyces subterraneus]